MRIQNTLAAIFVCVVVTTGCGSRMVGTYTADARLMEGKQETGDAEHSLDAVRRRLAEEGRSLELGSDGRYVHRFSASSIQEGAWSVEGDTLVLNDDTYNGGTIAPALRVEHRFPIGPEGEIIDSRLYGQYNLDVFYTKN